MKRIIGVLAGISFFGVLAGCSSMNVNLSGVAGGVDMGANVDPINKSIGADANKTFEAGGTETSIDAAASGEGVDVDTDIHHDFDQE